jgi:hypothetical protein
MVMSMMRKQKQKQKEKISLGMISYITHMPKSHHGLHVYDDARSSLTFTNLTSRIYGEQNERI